MRRLFLLLTTGAAALVLTISAAGATTLSIPGDQVLEATGPSGAVFSYTASATNGGGHDVPVDCSPGSGSTFPIGTTTVTCTAQDDEGTTGSFDVTVRDTTAPSVSATADVSTEATGPGGATVSFATPTATDVVDGSVAVNCDHASGATYPLGSTTVTCTATDAHGNTGSATFTVKVVDTTPPVLANVPAPAPVEATSHSGSQVFFTAPTASDTVDPGPIAVSCAPPSGSTFALGTTSVTCSGTDASGNTAAGLFSVRVADTTPPVLTIPADLTLTAPFADGIPAISLGGYLGAAKATDVADPAPVVTNDAKSLFPVGTTTVTFTARDASGNTTTKKGKVTVLAAPAGAPPAPPQPAPGTPPVPTPPAPQPVAPPTARDTTPPGNVRNLSARAGDKTVLLTWLAPGDADFDHVTVLRARAGAGSIATQVYRGSATRFRDRGLKNKVQYRYVVVSYDRVGNHGAGVSATAFPKALLLLAPTDGARLTKPPLLKWRKWPKATFYNVQLFRGTTKVFTAWPKANQLRLTRRWRYAGSTQTLSRGTYHWFVWPAFGTRVRPSYGGSLGSSSFVVAR